MATSGTNASARISARRRLGTTGLDIGPVAFGGTVLGWIVDEATSFTLLDQFAASGFNLIDTADSYYVWAPGLRGGESETIIGKWLKRRRRRDDIVIATKVGEEITPERKGLSRSHILKSADESLRRLKTDYIDLYQSHIDDTATPLDETLEAHGRLIDAGKVRAIGASNYNAARLVEARKVSDLGGRPAYQCLQTLYNLHDRADFEAELQSVSQAQGFGVLAYRSLARGFLSGKYRSGDDLSRYVRGEGVSHYLNPRGFAILSALEKVSASAGATMAQIALAWILAKPAVTAAIAGITRVGQIDELVRASELRLDADSLDMLDEASSWAAAGLRP